MVTGMHGDCRCTIVDSIRVVFLQIGGVSHISISSDSPYKYAVTASTRVRGGKADGWCASRLSEPVLLILFQSLYSNCCY